MSANKAEREKKVEEKRVITRNFSLSKKAAEYLDSIPWGKRSSRVSALLEREADKQTSRK